MTEHHLGERVIIHEVLVKGEDGAYRVEPLDEPMAGYVTGKRTVSNRKGFGGPVSGTARTAWQVTYALNRSPVFVPPTGFLRHRDETRS